jgi:hypothetical protein
MQRPVSLEDQEAICREYATKQGWTVLGEHVRSDAETSHQKPDQRSGLKSLVDDSMQEERPFKVLLVDDANRLAHAGADQLRMIKRFRDHGVKVVFAHDELDSDNPNFIHMLTLKAMTDQLRVGGFNQPCNFASAAGHKRVSVQVKSRSVHGTCFSRVEPFPDRMVANFLLTLVHLGTPDLLLAVSLSVHDGLRLDQIVNLRFEDLNNAHNTVTVPSGKLHGGENVRLSGITVDCLQEWLKHRSPAVNCGHLIHNSLGNPCTEKSLNHAAFRFFKKALRGQIINRYGIRHRIFHRLRITGLAKAQSNNGSGLY